MATFAEALALVLDGVDRGDGRRHADRPARRRDHASADRAARLRLGPATIVGVPHAGAGRAGRRDYPDALARSRAVDGRGLSKQAFHLLPRMAEVDEVMTPELQDRVFECHPETVFARLAGGPLTDQQALDRGPGPAPAAARPVAAEDGTRLDRPPSGAKADDVLDALAVAVTAWRFTVGDVEHLGDGARDARGLRMEIVV